MEENVYCEKVKKWLTGIASLNSCDISDSMITVSRDDSGISTSSSDNPYEKLVDELEKMYEEFGKGTSSTVTSACISPEIQTYPTHDDYLKDTYNTYPTRDDYLKETHNPFIEPVDGDLTIDDKGYDAAEVKVADVSKVDTSGLGHGFGDWIMSSDPDIAMTRYAPSVQLNDVINEGTRFVEAANTSPAPKPVPVKDTEFTRLWDKLDTI